MDMGENALGGGAREAVFNLAVVPGCQGVASEKWGVRTEMQEV